MINREDVLDVRTLSGIPYFEVQALTKFAGEVITLGPDRTLRTRSIENCGRALNRITYAFLKQRISSDHQKALSKRLAHTFGCRVSQSGCDVLFAPNASIEIAELKTDIPIVYYSDLTWANIVDYYPNCTSYFDFVKIVGERIEAAALQKAKALIFPSRWAANTAIEHYCIDPRKVHIIPDGANFDDADIPGREQALGHSLDGCITLLWVGVDWVRKGGVIAFDCLLELFRRSVNARLVVVGCTPPERYRHRQMTVVPFLDKRDSEQRRKLSRLFLDSNFLLFPTMAEAYGIVLCEASAYGLPVLVRNTGGVGGAITDGKNGFLMSPEASGRQYAEKILGLAQNKNSYDDLVRSSRDAYEERLNWDAWGRAVAPIFEDVVSQSRSR